MVIAGEVSGTGDGSVDGRLAFDPLTQNQRAGLLLLDGVVYLAWAGHCDWPPYHGWVMGYDAATLKQEVTWSVTPDGYGGGIWQSGQGLASDGTYIYAVSANGTVGKDDDPSSLRNRSESILKLVRAGNTLEIVSWFTPFDWEELVIGDIGLGSSGLLLIPGTHLGVTGSKGGMLYVVDTDNMGGVAGGSSDDNIVQSFDLNRPNNLHGAPLYWRGPDGGRVFTWANEDYLKSFPFLGADYAAGSTVLDVANVERSSMRAPSDDEELTLTPGGFLALSANGEEPGTAVLWASLPLSGNANQDVRPGILRAFDATDVGRELWSNRDNKRDSCGKFAKFAVPTVANGKVYLGSFSKQFCVYGVLE